MLIAHEGKWPDVDALAYVAPNAVICGDVHIGPGCRILFGAQVIAEGESIRLGADCIVMENAVLRSTSRHALSIGSHCLIGPQAHVVGCSVEDEVFIATGAAVFHGARVGRGSEVRVNGVVHIQTVLAPGETVPISWVAVGDPARILPPTAHAEIWQIQEQLNFPRTVYGLERSQASMRTITRSLSESLGSHCADRVA